MTTIVNKRPVFDAQILESICRTIADTNDGLTGTEIEKLLADCRITDIDSGITK